VAGRLGANEPARPASADRENDRSSARAVLPEVARKQLLDPTIERATVTHDARLSKAASREVRLVGQLIGRERAGLSK